MGVRLTVVLAPGLDRTDAPRQKRKNELSPMRNVLRSGIAQPEVVTVGIRRGNSIVLGEVPLRDMRRNVQCWMRLGRFFE